MQLDDATLLEPEREPFDDETGAGRERARRSHDPLGSRRIGGGVNLLSREVGAEAASVDGLGVAADPVGDLEEADREIGAGAAEAERVEAAPVQRRGAPVQAVEMRPPSGNRVGLVQTDRLPQRLAEPL